MIEDLVADDLCSVFLGIPPRARVNRERVRAKLNISSSLGFLSSEWGTGEGGQLERGKAAKGIKCKP